MGFDLLKEIFYQFLVVVFIIVYNKYVLIVLCFNVIDYLFKFVFDEVLKVVIEVFKEKFVVNFW